MMPNIGTPPMTIKLVMDNGITLVAHKLTHSPNKQRVRYPSRERSAGPSRFRQNANSEKNRNRSKPRRVRSSITIQRGLWSIIICGGPSVDIAGNSKWGLKGLLKTVNFWEFLRSGLYSTRP